ncbi:recombinase family protein [Actinokineospora sp.]|uniref:recombinase family protein n=1 Tax=Actinokineospora sp. TaxID=1872133 RepID=UPI003D6AFD18
MRVAVYTRSLVNPTLAAYITDHPTWEITRRFTGRALPDLAAAVRAGKVDAVVVTNLADFPGTPRALAHLLNAIRESGAALYAVEDEFDSTKPLGALRLELLALFLLWEHDRVARHRRLERGDA